MGQKACLSFLKLIKSGVQQGNLLSPKQFKVIGDILYALLDSK